MDNLGFALLHYRIRLSHSRVFLLVCSPLLLLLLAVIPHWGALMPTMRHSLSRLFDQGPSASAFFLLNALILTIIGSSKLEAARGRLGPQELEGSIIDLGREAAAQLQERNDGVLAENAARTDLTVGHSYDNCPSVLANGHGNHQNLSDERRHFLVSSRSLSAPDDRLSEKTSGKRAEVAKAVLVDGQHKPFNSTSLRKNKRPPVPLNPQRHGLQQSKLVIGSFSHVHAVGESSHAAEPASLKKSPMMPAKKARRANNSMDHPAPGESSHATYPASKRSLMMPANKAMRAGRSMDHPASALPTQLAPAVAAAAVHPSFEDVWAGIVAANAANYQHMRAASACDEGSSSPVDSNQPPAAAAVPSDRPAVASEPAGLPPSSTAAAASALQEAARSAVAAAAAAATEAAEVAEEKRNASDDEQDSTEVEELNRRAEEFIARFNHQMRVQRQESLQRRRRSRPCSNHYVQHVPSYRVQHPYPGLLVG